MSRIVDRPRTVDRRRAVAETRTLVIADEKIETRIDTEIVIARRIRRVIARSRVIASVIVAETKIMRSRDWRCHRRRRPLAPRTLLLRPLLTRPALRRLIVTLAPPLCPRSFRIVNASTILVVDLVSAPRVLLPLLLPPPLLLHPLLLPIATPSVPVAASVAIVSIRAIDLVIVITTVTTATRSPHGRWTRIVDRAIAMCTILERGSGNVIVIVRGTLIDAPNSIRVTNLCTRTSHAESESDRRSTIAAACLCRRRRRRPLPIAARLPPSRARPSLSRTTRSDHPTAAPRDAETTWMDPARRWIVTEAQRDRAAVTAAILTRDQAATTISETDEAEAAAGEDDDARIVVSFLLANASLTHHDSLIVTTRCASESIACL